MAWVECSFCSQRELAFMKCASVHGRVNSGCHPLLLPPAILLLMYVLAVFPSSQTHDSDKNKICFHRQLHNQSFAITYLEDLSTSQGGYSTTAVTAYLSYTLLSGTGYLLLVLSTQQVKLQYIKSCCQLRTSVRYS